jgi:LPXTG-motif cell wall-anchored protein
MSKLSVEEIEAMQKSIKIALGTAVSAALLLASTPAFAAPRSLPAGEALYAFGCDDGTEPAVGLVDVATGAVTEVVPGVAGQCYSSPAYNPVDGKIYVIDWSQGNTYQLGVFDPEAETLTLVDAFDCSPYTLAIDASGNAWVWDVVTEELHPVNLTDATCGDGVGVVAGGDYFFGMAFAPNGSLYAANYYNGEFGTVNTSTGAFTQVNSSAMPAFDNSGLTFDSSGTAWVVDGANEAEIYSADITDYAGTAELSGQLSFNGTDYFSEAIVVLQVPAAPELPDTGSASVALGVTGLAAAGVIALGAVMMIVRRRAS